jgi:hypothetical protein
MWFRHLEMCTASLVLCGLSDAGGVQGLDVLEMCPKRLSCKIIWWLTGPVVQTPSIEWAPGPKPLTAFQIVCDHQGAGEKYMYGEIFRGHVAVQFESCILKILTSCQIFKILTSCQISAGPVHTDMLSTDRSPVSFIPTERMCQARDCCMALLRLLPSKIHQHCIDLWC